MNVSFYRAYRLRSSASEVEQVAIGMTPLKDSRGYAFLVPGLDRWRMIVGKPLGQEDDVLLFEDSILTNADGSHTIWTLQPLTLEQFMEMEPWVDQHAHLAHQFRTDTDVQDYYRTMFLDDYWTEWYEEGTRLEAPALTN